MRRKIEGKFSHENEKKIKSLECSSEKIGKIPKSINDRESDGRKIETKY